MADAKKSRKYKIIKVIVTVLGVLCLPAVYMVPFMQPLRHEIFFWIGYIIFVLGLFVMWGMSGKKDYSYDDIDNRELDITKEILREKNKWFF